MEWLQILIIDSDENEAGVTATQLAEALPDRFTFVWMESAQALMNERGVSYDCIIADLDLRDENNLIDLGLICRNYMPHVPVIVHSGHDQHDADIKAIRAGAEDFCLKGDQEPEALARSVIRAIERKKLENELRREHAMFRGILDCMPDGVATADAHGNLTFFNKAASNLAGMGLKESKPNSWQEIYGIFRPDQVTPYPAEETPLFKAIQGKAVADTHLFVRHPALPQGRLLSLNGSPIVDGSGTPIGGVVCFREVQKSAKSTKSTKSDGGT